jgi:hypothetical protein
MGTGARRGRSRAAPLTRCSSWNKNSCAIERDAIRGGGGSDEVGIRNFDAYPPLLSLSLSLSPCVCEALVTIESTVGGGWEEF